jgi:hypothetical protein
VRLPFRIASRRLLVERAVAYAALVTVARSLCKRGVTRAHFVMPDRQFVEEVTTRCDVPEALVLPYVRLRCALNAFHDVEIGDRSHGRTDAKGRSGSSAERCGVNPLRLDSEALPVETKALAKALLGCILVRESEDGTDGGPHRRDRSLPSERSGVSCIFRQELPQRDALWAAASLLRLSNLRHVVLLQSFERVRRNGRGSARACPRADRKGSRSCNAAEAWSARAISVAARAGSVARLRSIDPSMAPTSSRAHPFGWPVTTGHPRRIRRSPRIGVTRAADRSPAILPRGNPYVSGPAA